MIKIVSIVAVLALATQINANIDATGFGLPADTHKTAFGAAIPESAGLADEGQAQLQLVDVSPETEQQQNVNNVKEMFANVFNSIKSQRETAMAATGAPPTA